jgi:hypothetical protein
MMLACYVVWNLWKEKGRTRDELAASMAPSCRLSLSGCVPVLDGMEVAGHEHPDGTLALSVEEDVGRRTCIRDMY